MLLALPLVLAALGSSDASAATVDDLDGALQSCGAAVNPLPALTPAQRQELLAGQVVRMLDRADDLDQPSAAVGLALLRAPREALWIASQDPHASVDPSLTELLVEDLGAKQLWYGYYDLPAPLADRQWVVASGNNLALAAATGDQCWEHSWRLVPGGVEDVRDLVAEAQPGGLTADRLDRARETPMNEGSWLMAPVGEGAVLVAYQARSVVGGVIPDWLVARVAMSRLEDALRRLEERALAWSPGHYSERHEPVAGGNGEPLQPLS